MNVDITPITNIPIKLKRFNTFLSGIEKSYIKNKTFDSKK